MNDTKIITITVTESGENDLDICVKCDVSLKVTDMVRVADHVSKVNLEKLKEYAHVNKITDISILNKVSFNDLKS